MAFQDPKPVSPFRGRWASVTLREALSQVPDPRAQNRRYPLLDFLAFLRRVGPLPLLKQASPDGLTARANLHLLHLGLHKASGHTTLAELVGRGQTGITDESLLS